ncbi:hypothetical protein GYMLUDRAFT_43852 [Collybiopsis luxurians FD-317 M1]|uniref:Unplaced genomic scaffold GYMLUscaffold_27, whole genome shotgun sequence n=1 Tax=Collybiopsis luxurians FD-317 M1 TaxID=944289 RepID=A0A0D0CNZ2_9AGAR|nr:hypothetical protein GYMLUDRAFT_43852 [Collybiopsis luxurians FD-317 M1]
MSLDQNLFTLVVTPSTADPNVIDLVDPNSGQIHYRKQRVPGPMYKVEVYDFMSESLLITASAPSATSKQKTLELYNPTIALELKYTGTLTFRWSFKWEEHDFEWKREECYLIRKPDPPVLVAITKEPAGRLKSTSVQVLDYNLNRFDINDRKGLEIVILTALLTFHDSNDNYHTPKASAASSPNSSPIPTPSSSAPIILEPPPPPPPKPEPKTGVDRIAELQAIRGEFNEVTVEAEGSADDYSQYCWNLLQDDAMLFVTIKSHTSLEVQKVVQVAEETKRIAHKAGMESDLNQYVIYDAEVKKGPKRINLDDDNKGKKSEPYVPPSSLSIHLSKIPMPELQPPKPGSAGSKQSSSSLAPPPPPLLSPSKRKDGAKQSVPPSPVSPGPAKHKSNRLFRRSHSRSPSPPQSHPSHTHSYQVHPHQPSPSPSQLNNPMIYAAPPPPPKSHSSHRHNHSRTHSSAAPPHSPVNPSPQVQFAPPPGPPPMYSYAPHPYPPPSPSSQQQSGNPISELFERFHLH